MKDRGEHECASNKLSWTLRRTRNSSKVLKTGGKSMTFSHCGEALEIARGSAVTFYAVSCVSPSVA